MAALGFPLPGVLPVAVALAESVGSLLVAVGLLTRASWGFGGFAMLVAIHRHLRARQSAELARLYQMPAIAVGLAGARRYSVGALLARPASPVPAGEWAAPG